MKVSKIMLAGKGQEIVTSKGLIKSQFTHVWIVFDKLHTGPTQFEWLPNVTYKGSEK